MDDLSNALTVSSDERDSERKRGLIANSAITCAQIEGITVANMILIVFDHSLPFGTIGRSYLPEQIPLP